MDLNLKSIVLKMWKHLTTFPRWV